MAGYQTSRKLQSEIICGKYVLSLGKKTLIMGIVNTTPDSFSDGGKFFNKDDAIRHCYRLAEEGADIIDIGGESTRPDALPVSAQEEIDRTIPVIYEVSKSINIPISIDTQKAIVAKEALEAGATMVNDISSLRDAKMAEILAKYNIPVVIMHMQGTPATMQKNPYYKNVVEEIKNFFISRMQYAEVNGININNIIIDPGIGFGKTLEHNLEIFRHLNDFTDLGRPLLVGPSRKSFIGKITGADINNRLYGTVGAVCVSILKGANIIRVHDVKEVREAVAIVDSIIYTDRTN